jgi:hypothetical protein
MTSLHDRFEELAEDTLVYGDVDRAIRMAARRRRNSLMALGAAGVAAVVALVAGAEAVSHAGHEGLQPAGPGVTGPPRAVVPLEAGVVTPGRYRSVVQRPCEETDVTCLAKPSALAALDVTVPAGWDAAPEYQSLFPMPGRDNASPKDPALVMGWTNVDVRLYSHPCHADGTPPDIAVGPTVDDLVDAVTASRSFDVSTPRAVTLGAHHGRFLRLTGPADISKCGEWRPWDPAPYLQGPGNIWDLWVMDVAGTRVVIMAQYFPTTPSTIKAELRAMAESVRFVPRSS